VSYNERQVIDREGPAERPGGDVRSSECERLDDAGGVVEVDERAARATLRGQIARLERERSAIVAERFPHIAAPTGHFEGDASAGSGGPMLLDLGALERIRDQLAAGVQELRASVLARSDRERRARQQLERMRLEPGRYKFARLPVRDLGVGVCGVWEVRPRLGLIGMLAGWWQLKLSSGCPLAMGSRSTRDPDSPR
jgi:hypothetical protein